jgi:hypothetical protein
MEKNPYYSKIDRSKVTESYFNNKFYSQVFLLGSDEPKNTPIILYKYFPLGIDGEENFTNRIISTIAEGMLWFSTRGYLNDPCEMSYVTKSAESFPEKKKNVFSFEPLDIDVANNFEKCRICCFSETWKSGPMWANYAKGQSGICIGFDVSNYGDCFFPVIYKDEVDEDFLKGKKGLVNAFSLKEESWAYEKEWRLIFPWTPFEITENKSERPLGVLQSVNFDIKEVVFGNNVSSNDYNTIMHYLNKVNKTDKFKTVINQTINRIEI